MFFILSRLFLCATGVLALAAQNPKADLVVENANIYTVDPKRPKAKALAVSGKRIVAVGDDVSAYVGASTRRIDAKGAAVIPGLIDSHVHMAGLGDLLEIVNLRDVNSLDRVKQLVREAAAKRPKGEWIRGRAWDQTNWGGEFPDHRLLDEAAPDHPVYLTRVDGHAAWVNRKAMEMAGIARTTADPPGGKIIRNAGGDATGILVDRAMGLVGAKIPAATAEQIERRLEHAARECARLGMTSVHDAGAGPVELAAYRRLIARKKLPVRVYFMIRGNGELWREYLAKGPETGEFLTVRSIKLVADGAMGSRGAAFWQPYSDDKNNSGLLILKKEEIEAVAREAVAKGFQVNTHAIGDRANRTALDAYAAVLGGPNDKRFRIEHSQVVSLPDFALFANNNVIASIQSTHATSDMRWAQSRLGPDRLQGAWAARRFLNAGVRLANGSDFPVEDPNPMWGFYAAVTRQDRQGNPPGGFQPDQKLTREEALKSFTLDGAYAAFEEKEKGSLEVGKWADFLVLDQDLMTAPDRELWKTKVRMTILGGEIVYQGN